MTDQPAPVWIDGHPLMEAIASAVFEQCTHHDSGLVLDDPRNIAAAAYAAITAPAPTALRDLYAAAIASYDHAVGQATDPAPRGHHYGQADAALAVCDRELERLRAQAERVRQLAERWEKALAPDLAYARALRAALDPKEQP